MITFQDHGVKCFRIKSDALCVGMIARYQQNGKWQVVFNTNADGNVLTAEDLDRISDKIKDLNK